MAKQLILIGLVTLGILLLMLLVKLLRPKEKYPYEARELLTHREWEFYSVLAPVAMRHGWLLLIKLRLADILAVRKGTEKYMSYFNKIKAKHTDFVLYDPETLEILAGLELDDPSHEREDRRERDDFVDHAYQAAGIPLLHVYMGAEEEELEDFLLEFLPDLGDERESEDLSEAPDELQTVIAVGDDPAVFHQQAAFGHDTVEGQVFTKQ